MKTEKIEKYWNNFFGIKGKDIKENGVLVVPHNYLEDYNGAWIFKRNNQIIVSVPLKKLKQISNKVERWKPKKDEIFSHDFINYLFGKNIERIIGPTYQGYYDDTDTKIKTSTKVVKISFDEHDELIKKLSNSGDEEGWSNSGVNKDSARIYGYFHKAKIESIGSYKLIKGGVGFIGVYTNPKWRGMGFSQEVLKKIVMELSTKGKLILYQTLISNKPSIRIANKIGFKEYANHVAIRLKK